MNKDEALDLALEALGQLWLFGDEAAVIANPAITAIKQARSAPVQEPSGFFRHEDVCGDEVGHPTPYYLAPPAAPEEPVYHLRQFGDVTKEQLDRYMATGDINPQPAPVQVSPLEFVTMVMEKEHLVGKPLFWAEWPNKEKNNG